MRRKIPSMQSLLCFEAAARHESYTRAAQELALTQSAISRQITLLEDFLEIKLFRRAKHGVSLTSGGRDYAQNINRHLDSIERDTRDVISSKKEDGGVIRLAVVPTFATQWLIPRLSDFSENHHDIVVHIETRTRPFMFSDNVMDAALFAGTPTQISNWAGTKAIMLMDETVIPVCSPVFLQSHTGKIRPVSPKALAAWPLLQQSTRPEGWRHWFSAMGVENSDALAGPRFELFSMLAAAAKHGLGVALMPKLLIADELARGELVIACNRVLAGERQYYFVTPTQAPIRGVVTRFQNWLVSKATEFSRPLATNTQSDSPLLAAISNR